MKILCESLLVLAATLKGMKNYRIFLTASAIHIESQLRNPADIVDVAS
jgi:hypothetical protein